MAQRLGALAPPLTETEWKARIIVRKTHASDEFDKLWGELSAAIETYYNVSFDRIGGRPRRVAVPFGRIALVHGGPEDEPASKLKIQFEENWGDLLPDGAAHVRSIAPRAAPKRDAALVSFFGFGVWTPGNEPQTGAFRVRPYGDHGAGEEPRLPNGQPAAWWEHQTGLAFSINTDAALARVSDARLNAAGVFFFGKTEDHRDPAFVWLPPSGDGARTATAFSVPQNWWAREGEWMPVEANSRGGGCAFEFCFETDNSRGALRRTKPQRTPCLIVAGIYLPEPRSVPGVAHVWLEAQGDGTPVYSALMPRRRALVFDSGSRYALFERHSANQWTFEKGADYDFLLSNEGRMASVEKHMSVKLFSPSGERDGNENLSLSQHVPYAFQLVVAASDERPFGYIPLKPFDETAPQDYRLVSGATSNSRQLSLRWLNDAASLVDGEFWSARQRLGLADWALRDNAVTLTVNSTASWVEGKGQNSFDVTHGRPFALGPLLVAVDPGTAGS